MKSVNYLKSIDRSKSITLKTLESCLRAALSSYVMMLAAQGAIFCHPSETGIVDIHLMMLVEHSGKDV
jgi:hypothetical protein